MKIGRPTDEVKDKILKIRVTEDFYTRLENKAKTEDKYTSEYAREILERSI